MIYNRLLKIAKLFALAVDQIATNRTVSDSIPDNYFSPDDTLEDYRRKSYDLYLRDIKPAHYDRYVRLYMKQGHPEELAREMAEQEVWRRSVRQADKSIDSHQHFVNEMRGMGVPSGSRIVAPGAGTGDEQVVAPEYDWLGLEYQQNSANIGNQRNKQMGLPEQTRQWSFINQDPDMPLDDDWRDVINPLDIDGDGNIDGMYAKHACGGLTDGSLLKAVESGLKYIFIATCCANRYTEVSWRVLEPKHDDGTPMSYEEYKNVAYKSKRQDEKGQHFVNIIDQWRQEFLESHGYKVTRGRNKFGPFIKAIKE